MATRTKQAAPVAPVFADLTLAEQIADVAKRNEAIRGAFGTVLADGSDVYWEVRGLGEIGTDGSYGTEAALFVDALGFAKSQGSILKRLAATVHFHRFSRESAEFVVVRDRGGMAWASFLTPSSDPTKVPAELTAEQRARFADVARYNGSGAFVAAEAAAIMAGTLTLDESGRPVRAVDATRAAQPNDGTGTGGDEAEAEAAKQAGPSGTADPVVQARNLSTLLALADADECDAVEAMIADALAARRAALAEAEAEQVPA